MSSIQDKIITDIQKNKNVELRDLIKSYSKRPTPPHRGWDVWKVCEDLVAQGVLTKTKKRSNQATYHWVEETV
jgi:hypothetical protein